jgi:hypothetical protein
MKFFDFLFKTEQTERIASLEKRVKILEEATVELIGQFKKVTELQVNTTKQLNHVVKFLKIQEQRKITPLQKKEYYN